MSHVRCFAHSLVIAAALVSWGGCAYIGIWHGGAEDPLRFIGMVLLSMAAVTTGLALLPVVVWSFLKRYTHLLDSTHVIEAAWQMGAAAGERRRGARMDEAVALRVVGD